MLYGVNPSDVAQPGQPRNESGDLIAQTGTPADVLAGKAVKVGYGFERDAKGQVVGPDWEKGRSGAVEYRAAGVNWEKSFFEPSACADGSVRQGGFFYDARAIPQKGYEPFPVFVPSEVEVQAPRVGAGGGLNRNDAAADQKDEAPAADPHWPFMYVAGRY